MPKFDPDFLKKDITLQYSHWWTYPKATLTGHTPQGNIYALPADKMPCLVADIRQIAHISNARTPFQNSLMLNPFKKEELIPEQ